VRSTKHGRASAPSSTIVVLARWPRACVLAAHRRVASWTTVRALLVAAHLVPAIDHLPRFIAAPSWADGWRGVGALVAIACFAAPRHVRLVVAAVAPRVRSLVPAASLAP
jgi:hypothetical protein